jgi:hypothetical protein
MFGFFKKRDKFANAAELSSQSDAALREVKEKWIYFHNTIHLKDDVPLSLKIDAFSQPVAQFFQQKYPQLLLGGSQIFWMTIFTAVLESGTHSTDQVNAAISQLQKKYAR